MSQEADLLVEGIPEPEYFEALREFLERLVQELGEPNWEMSLTLCGNDYIAGLNRDYRGKEGATDVLTFVMDEGDEPEGFAPDPSVPQCVGDIVVSLERVRENAEELGIPYDEELKRVIVHGILHLKGMTHEGYDWEQGMLREQETLLKKYKDIRFTEDDETFLD